MSGAGDRKAMTVGYDRLLRRLSPQPAQATVAFERLRQRLVRLLAWRGTSDPEGLADETLERLARQLGAGLEIVADDPFRYAARVAHLVAHEALRRQRREREAHEAAHAAPLPSPPSDLDERWMQLLDACLAELAGDDRRLILAFYRGEKGGRIARRRALAEDLAISVNALRIRAHRLRQRLERCVRRRLTAAEGAETPSARWALDHEGSPSP